MKDREVLRGVIPETIKVTSDFTLIECSVKPQTRSEALEQCNALFFEAGADGIFMIDVWEESSQESKPTEIKAYWGHSSPYKGPRYAFLGKDTNN